jgi:hypothetical protein
MLCLYPLPISPTVSGFEKFNSDAKARHMKPLTSHKANESSKLRLLSGISVRNRFLAAASNVDQWYWGKSSSLILVSLTYTSRSPGQTMEQVSVLFCKTFSCHSSSVTSLTSPSDLPTSLTFWFHS